MKSPFGCRRRLKAAALSVVALSLSLVVSSCGVVDEVPSSPRSPLAARKGSPSYRLETGCKEA